ncbi:NAD(P)/FAD-dependent oxidoreductase [Crateriforma conspicua]|uniref:Ubiquinone biosynthesis hydroxylase family protein n=1 Tax=Crateriforma conspicua TaxID=2527996 RepID=A0A5C5Y0N1_9PLAN|nr:FAD-dependent oxidoreductase [Crateriforma conspicua]TWT69167.1 ubiquinone biosynthesis hydroxylase family protein [Crateriforma conspicua]
MNAAYDVAIVGSGFSGSLLATILADRGRRVALIDRQKHPRFAVGESSTPLADAILRHLGEQYGRPDWVNLSAYGSWKDTMPAVSCGLKRGFSYYRHHRQQPYRDSQGHDSSLLVAASRSDEAGDTHWYRPDVDHYFHQQAIKAGVSDLTGWQISGLDTASPHQIGLHDVRHDHQQSITADWLIDASGPAAAVARLLDRRPLAQPIRTRTSSTWMHVKGLPAWSDWLCRHDIGCDDDPFDADAAAVHHVLDQGWIWCLRFDNGITSVGWTSPGETLHGSLRSTIDDYPSLNELFSGATRCTEIYQAESFQRRFDPVLGPRCLMTPTAAFTLDPLHSTGIAVGLAGVARLADLILNQGDQPSALDQYRRLIQTEFLWLDDFVGTAYSVMPDFSRFSAACQWFMLAAIACEEQIQRSGFDCHRCLYSADNTAMRDVMRGGNRDLRGPLMTAKVTELLRRSALPFNTAGLFDPDVANRFAYTATKS